MKSGLASYLGAFKPEDFVKNLENSKYFPAYKVKFKLCASCNLRCKKCALWRETAPHPLTTPEVLNVIAQIARLGCRRIKLSGGEVTLRSDLPQVIQYASALGVKSAITTNGTLIDRANAELLVRSGLSRVTVSLDSCDPPTHDNLVGVPGAWKRSLHAFSCLRTAAASQRKALRLTWQTVVCRQNFRSLARIAVLAADVGADGLSLLPFISNRNAPNTGALSDAEILYFLDHLLPEIHSICQKRGLDLVDTAYYRSSFHHRFYANSPCYLPFITYYIAWTGDVYCCCYARQNTLPLGSIRDSPLHEILDSERARALRKATYPRCTDVACLRCTQGVTMNLQIRHWLDGRREQPEC